RKRFESRESFPSFYRGKAPETDACDRHLCCRGEETLCPDSCACYLLPRGPLRLRLRLSERFDCPRRWVKSVRGRLSMPSTLCSLSYSIGKASLFLQKHLDQTVRATGASLPRQQ